MATRAKEKLLSQELNERRAQLIRARTPEFLLGLASRLWTTRSLREPFAPSLATTRHPYMLANDPVALQWVSRFIAEFIHDTEADLRIPPQKPSDAASRIEKKLRSEKKAADTIAEKYWAEDRRRILKAAGFTDPRLFQLMVNILMKQKRHPRNRGQRISLSRRLVLYYLPPLFHKLAQRIHPSCGRPAGGPSPDLNWFEPPGGGGPISHDVLAIYLPVLVEELKQFLNRVGVTHQKRGRRRGRAGALEPVDLSSCRTELKEIRNILLKSVDTRKIYARLGWFLEISGIWSFHALESIEPHKPPAPNWPFPWPGQFVPCNYKDRKDDFGRIRGRCEAPSHVPACSKRTNIVRRFAHHIIV